MSIAFIACVEAGRLEPMGRVLFRSIRRYAGRFSRARIVSFNPRGGPPLSSKTLALYEELGVEQVEQNLNPDHGDLPWSNKIFSGEWAEQHLDEEFIVFLDSDMFFCQEPDQLELPDGIDAGARPVNRKRRGSTGPGDQREEFWQGIYRHCKVEQRPFVETTVDSERIRAYWNAGLLTARREAGLFGAWRRDFETLIRAEHWLGKKSRKNLDQFSLAATLARIEDRVLVHDPRYNYPLPWREALAEPLRSAPLEDLVLVHYFGWFNMPGILSRLKPPLDPDSNMVRFLEPYLPFEPIDDSPTRGNKDDLVE